MTTMTRTNSTQHATADIIIVDNDLDCADALQLLLSDVPGVGYVETVSDPESALTLLAGRAPDVAAYAAPAASPPDGQFQVIFLDVKSDRLREASVYETLGALRAMRPDAAIVLLCLYPDRTQNSACSLADRCVPKDTSYHDLRALIDDLRAGRAGQRSSAA
jgi:DNA-binding NarL/FixJ family response regulator